MIYDAVVVDGPLYIVVLIALASIGIMVWACCKSTWGFQALKVSKQ